MSNDIVEMNTKVIIKMINIMDMVLIKIMMGINMKDNLKMGILMEQE